jgi:putative flippase GtrA
MQKNTPRASELFREKGALLGYLLGIPWLLGLFWAAHAMGGSLPLNVLILLGSGLAGWILGVLVTPLPHEATRFSEYGKTITAFVSGFLLSKFERLFDLAITQKSDVSDIFVSRILLAAASSMLGILFTFVWRSYVSSRGSGDNNSG